jgi:hypothetical protein
VVAVRKACTTQYTFPLSGTSRALELSTRVGACRISEDLAAVSTASINGTSILDTRGPACARFIFFVWTRACEAFPAFSPFVSQNTWRAIALVCRVIAGGDLLLFFEDSLRLY